MTNNSNEEPTQLTEEGSGDQQPDKTDSPTTITSFNEDLLCCHGKVGC